MEEKLLYTEEQLEKLEKLRNLSAAEKRANTDRIKHAWIYNNLDEPLAIGEKVFYEDMHCIISDRTQKEKVGRFSKKDKYYYLYEVKQGVTIFKNVQRYHLRKRVVKNYDDVVVSEEIKKLDTKRVLSWYRSIAYKSYWDDDIDVDPNDPEMQFLELQLKAELSRREHIPSKKEGSLLRRLKAKKKK